MAQVSEVTVTWTPITSGRVQSVQVQSRIMGQETDPEKGWTEQAAALPPSAGNFKFTANAPGTMIEVRMRNRMEDGVYSPWVYDTVLTVDIRNVYAQGDPPANPLPGWIWIETDVSPIVTKVWTGSAWLVSATVGATASNWTGGATINAILDPTFLDPSYWTGLTIGTNGTAPGQLGVDRVARQVGDGTTTAATTFTSTSSPVIPVRGGEKLQFGASVHIGAIVTGTITVQLVITSRGGTTSTNSISGVTNTANAVTLLTKNVILPADAVSIQFQFQTAWNANVARSGIVNFARPFVINLTQLGSNIVLGDGTTATEAILVTSFGTAQYVNGQGLLATLNTVPPEKLTFGSTDNMILDAEFTSTSTGTTAYWQVPSTSTIYTTGAANTAMSLRRVVSLTAGDGTLSQAMTTPILMTSATRTTVEPGARYSVASRAYYPQGFSGQVRLNIVFRDAGGNSVATFNIPGASYTAAAASAPAGQDITNVLTAPATAATIEFRYQCLWGTTLPSAGAAIVGYPRIQRVISLGSGLIGDASGNPLTDGSVLNQWVASPGGYFGFDADTVPAGWGAYQASLSIVASTGTASGKALRVTATAVDPNVIFDGPNRLGSTVPRLRIRARPLTANPDFDGIIFWRTPGHDFNSTYFLRIKSPALIQNQWTLLDFDLSGQTDWLTSTITGLRVDLAVGQQNWEIDYITFLTTAPPGAYVGSTLATALESSAAAATAQIAAYASDNVLSRNEKSDMLIRLSQASADKDAVISRAQATSISSQALADSFAALNNYLTLSVAQGGIGAGALNDLTTDNPINGVTLRSRWGDFFTQLATLAKLTETAAGTTSTWTGVTGSGKPQDNATVGAPYGTNVNGVASQDITGRTQYLTANGWATSALLLNTNLLFGAKSVVSATATAADQGSGTGSTITIPAHTRYYANAAGQQTINYNSGTITNRSYDTTYYVYCDDATFTGGAVTYQATTDPTLLAGSIYRYHVTTITTPISGGAGTDGSSGGGGGKGAACVAADSYLPFDLQARDVRPGDLIKVLNYRTMQSATLCEVEANVLKVADCVRIRSATGITLVASKTTPVTLRDGSMLLITQALGHELPVEDDNGFRWEEIVSVDEAGEREISHISVHKSTYAAGERPGAFIYTHNLQQAKV